MSVPDNCLPIATVGIPTRNRLGCLQRCLLSYLEAAQRSGRPCSYVIIDGSDRQEDRQECRRGLGRLRDGFRVEIDYAGPGETERFAAALADQTGLAPQLVDFALRNPLQCPVATGASRNALLLQGVGELLLQVDDDTVSRLAPAPGAQPGLVLATQPDPTEFWFYSEGNPAPAADQLSAGDLLAVHETLLGTSPSVVANGQVLVTAAGVVGDSGMGSSLHFLGLEGASRARLLESETTFWEALARRQVLRAVTRPTLSTSGVCMALNLGLDNRQLLPPFLPVQRNQDGVFGGLVKTCCPGSLFGYLPWALFHQPLQRRLHEQSALELDAASLGTGQIVLALLLAGARRPLTGTTAQNLGEVGCGLVELSRAPVSAFTDLLRRVLGQQLTSLAGQWEAKLRLHQDQPELWASHLRRLLETVRAKQAGAAFWLPRDLVEHFGGAQALLCLRRLLELFGELLQAWPTLVAAAGGLRAGGRRLAQAV